MGWAQLSYLLWFACSTYVVEHHLCSVSCICMPIQTSKQSVCVCVCASAFVVASRKEVISLGSHRIAREFLELLQIHRIPSELNAFLREAHRIWNKDAGRFPKESLSHNMGRPGAAPGAARGAARGGQGQPGQPGGHAWPPQAKAGPRRSKMPKDSHACHPKRPDPPQPPRPGPSAGPARGAGG